MLKNRQAAIGFIFVTILIDCIGFGVIIPVMPRLIQTLGHFSVSEGSRYNGWLLFIYALMQFVCAPIMGSLSDRYGRRPILLISLLGFGIDYMFLAFSPSIAWLFVGRTLAGIFGASFTTATAYIADITVPEKRAQSFGIVGAAFGIGFIIGPVIGGIAAQYGIRTPFMVAACLSLLNWLYGLFVVPESLPKDQQRAFDIKRANPIGALRNINRYPAITGLIIGMFLFFVAGTSVQGLWAFYTKEKFHWDEKTIGYSLSVVGVTIAIVQGGLIRIIVPRIGQRAAVYAGLGFYLLGLVAFALSGNTLFMFLSIIVYCLGGFAGPSIQGLMSGKVPNNEQGELQGLVTSLQSLSTIIGPLFMSYLFSFFTSKDAPFYFPGAPFIAGAILIVFGGLFIIWSIEKHHTEKVPEVESVASE